MHVFFVSTCRKLLWESAFEAFWTSDCFFNIGTRFFWISACRALGYLHAGLFGYLHVGLWGYTHVYFLDTAHWALCISACAFLNNACGAFCVSACWAFWPFACGAICGHLHACGFLDTCL